VQQHPDKTFIGRIARGFDFLGYRFSSSGLGIAPRTMERFAERMTRLYEQGADANRIGAYARHWWRWVQAGVPLTRCLQREGRPCWRPSPNQPLKYSPGGDILR
jgi:RNA-directed DNA polymerase